MALVLKNLLFTVLVPGTVVVYIPLQIAESRSPVSGPMLAIAAAVLITGAAIYAWCVWDFASFGRGTPAPIDAPKELVVRGLYRYTRNPMYLGVLTVILGWAVFFRAVNLVLYALAVGTCFHLFVVLYEERHLAAYFGDDYAAYCSQVARWLPRSPSGRSS
ncbi:MAG: isoprenylcysteine carboxylmethyltransferase family protein [Deltaproteobacteria bacterium]|nr:isoprenylcysteine carboxylmethyltransferase family protein [Deltaproteobacteria bacterium]MBW2399551.1 isoprenylcysteine carboxylmethyltransferase family protein [Deltaproteobacteria bacterium]